MKIWFCLNYHVSFYIVHLVACVDMSKWLFLWKGHEMVCAVLKHGGSLKFQKDDFSRRMARTATGSVQRVFCTCFRFSISWSRSKLARHVLGNTGLECVSEWKETGLPLWIEKRHRGQLKTFRWWNYLAWLTFCATVSKELCYMLKRQSEVVTGSNWQIQYGTRHCCVILVWSHIYSSWICGEIQSG